MGLWQANRHIGATLVGEPGAPIWDELITDKPESALAFYEAVVGFTHSAVEMAPGQNYTLLRVGGNNVGGCTEPPMPGVPNHWHVYFAVDDADATAGKAAEGGGQVMVEPFDIPSVGRSVSDRPAGRSVQRAEAGAADVGSVRDTEACWHRCTISALPRCGRDCLSVAGVYDAVVVVEVWVCGPFLRSFLVFISVLI